jgi:type 1 glutamine amidotransferase
VRIFSIFCGLSVILAADVSTAANANPPGKIRVLIWDGENPYHEWQKTTPALKKILEDSGRFHVDVVTSPPEGIQPGSDVPFRDYDVVLSNYNSQKMPPEDVKQAFLDYLNQGGGFVCFHSADNSFAHWPEYNRAIGLGGWYERDKTWGPYVYFKDDNLVRDASDGPCGHHGPRHDYVVKTRDSAHPITKGLPPAWLHVEDELYDSLRGPAENMTVLATAFSEKKFDGTDRDEPMLLALSYGKGRVFHTAMGHDEKAMSCVGFITTLLRGTEWAATGEVTFPVPDDFPTADKVSVRSN